MIENRTWTIKASLDWISGYLARKGDRQARISAEWLISCACGLSRIGLYVDPDRILTTQERGLLRDYCLRRAAGEPLQYIIGKAPFRHIVVKVRPGVLIPRPETEVLVSEALSCLRSLPREQDYAEKPPCVDTSGRDVVASEYSGSFDEDAQAAGYHHDEDVLVADIGTGTGCIAASLAWEHPHIRVIATDISPDAIDLAEENIAALGLEERIEFKCGNLGEPIDAALLGHFDLIVSNPPYIPSAVISGLSREVKEFEPEIALDGGADGLDLFRPLLAWAQVALHGRGAFVVELFEEKLDEAARMAYEAGFATVRIAADLNGKPRILVAKR